MIKYIIGDSMTNKKEFQMFLNQLKASLEKNKKLSEPTKESIFLLAQEMYLKFQTGYSAYFNMNFPKERLLQRLETMSISLGSKLADHEAYQYDMIENKVRMRPDLVGDGRNVLCQSLLEMAFIESTNKGMNEESLIAIKRGMLEILANHLVENDSEFGIAEDEQIIVNLMDIITDGKLLTGFVYDSSEIVEGALQESNLVVISDYANYNYMARKHSASSQLADIEIRLITHFFNRSDSKKIQIQMDDFEACLVSHPQVMANPEQYRNLQKVGSRFQTLKELQKVVPFPQPIVEEGEKTNAM